MAWTTYKALDVPDTFDPTGNAGEKLTDDLKELADRAPYKASSAPDAGDDVNDGFEPGSTWLDTSTGYMWVCVDNTSTAAVWRTLYLRTAGALVLCPGGSIDQRGIQVDPEGNIRGEGAIDFQFLRSSSSDVASGDHSFIAGGNGNKASGVNSHSAGYFCIASGSSSHAEGFTTTASGTNAHAEGDHAVASGYDSHAEGFVTHATVHSAHAEGFFTHSNGISAHSEGSQTSADGNASHAEGSYTTASANYSHAEGYFSAATLLSQHAHASGRFTSDGDAQFTRAILRRATTNNTATELTLDGSTPASGNRFAIDDEHAYSCFVRISARRDTGSDQAFFVRQLVIERTSGTVALEGSVQTVGTDINPAGWSVSLTADNTNKSLKIEVTGAASTNIRWVAVVEAVEIEYAN